MQPEPLPDAVAENESAVEDRNLRGASAEEIVGERSETRKEWGGITNVSEEAGNVLYVQTQHPPHCRRWRVPYGKSQHRRALACCRWWSSNFPVTPSLMPISTFSLRGSAWLGRVEENE